MTETKPPNITLSPVQSSNVESWGHCADTNTIGVKFKNGGTYHYAGADGALFQKMSDHESPGRAVRELLVSRGVKGVRQPEPQEAT